MKAARYARDVKPAEYERLIARGDPPAMADYLSDEYPEDGMGSHLIPRRAKFPKTVAGIPVPQGIAGKPLLPRSYIDGPFNVLKPQGLSRDQFNAEHFGIDDHFHGGYLPPEAKGGGGWKGLELGFQRYGPVKRLVRGAPPPLKRAVGGAAAVGELTAYDLWGGDRPNDP